MSNQRTAKLQFLPYPFESHGLPTAVQAAQTDGQDALALVNVEQHVIDLSDNHDWQALELTLSATFDPDLLLRLVPESERDKPPVDLVARIRCTKTRLRYVVPFANDNPGTGVSTMQVTLTRKQVRHEVEILPMLVRSQAGAKGASQHAWQPMARLAEGRAWHVQVDKAPPPNTRYLDIHFHNFADLPQAHTDGLYYLDCQGSEPVLWLNNRSQEVATALQSKGTTGPMARLREVLFAQIEVGVWQQLFAHAAADLNDGEVKKGWQKAVLDEWLPRLLPQFADSESRLAELERQSTPKERAELLGRLDCLLQGRAKYESAALKLTREILK